MMDLAHAQHLCGCEDILFFGLLVLISILTPKINSKLLQLLILIILILIVSAITT